MAPDPAISARTGNSVRPAPRPLPPSTLTLIPLPTPDAPTTATADAATADAATADAASAPTAESAPAPGPPANGAARRPSPRPAPGAGALPSGGIPRAERPGAVPVPEHPHLPGWVRRDFGRARPALADLLGLLQGEQRASFQRDVEQLTAGISGGRFSLAWQYPALIDQGRALCEAQRARVAEQQRAARELERVRRGVSGRLRDAAGMLAADAGARLGRELRAATSPEALAAVDAEVVKGLAAARGSGDKRREREIERTRSRILRTLPSAAAAAEEPAETWQDVLRKFAEQQSGTPA